MKNIKRNSKLNFRASFGKIDVFVYNKSLSCYSEMLKMCHQYTCSIFVGSA